jgi:hypothetical protein
MFETFFSPTYIWRVTDKMRVETHVKTRHSLGNSTTSTFMQICSAVAKLLHKDTHTDRETDRHGRANRRSFATFIRELVKNYQRGMTLNGMIFGANFMKIRLLRIFCRGKRATLQHSRLTGSRLSGEFVEYRSHWLCRKVYLERLRHFKVKGS